MEKEYVIAFNGCTIGELKKLIAEIPNDYAVDFGAIKEFYIDVYPSIKKAIIDAETFIGNAPKRVCAHCGSENLEVLEWESYYADDGSGVHDYVDYECKDCGKMGQHTYNGYLVQNHPWED